MPSHRTQYKTKGYLDSIAFSVVKYSDIKMVDMRLELAKKYTKSKLYYEAYKEYKALFCINPNNAENLIDMATSAVRISDIPVAIEYFKESLEIKENYFPYFKIGELLVLKGDYNSSIEYFEKAFPLAPANIRSNILRKTYVALIYSNRIKDAKKVKDVIIKSNPDLVFNIPPKKYIYTNYTPLPIKTDINAALTYWNNNDLDKALITLQQSLNKYNAPITKRYIGEILLQKKELKQAYSYLNSVFDEYKFDPNYLRHMIVLTMAKNDKAKTKELIDFLELIDPSNNNY